MSVKTLKKYETTTSEKFQNAEQLWFWFLYSKSVQNGFHYNTSSIKRPCEILDVESLVTKLYLCGKLNDEQLAILKKFGDKKRAPHQYIYHENRAASLWKSAMDVIGEYASNKGWLVD